jgi:hypothetical protein
LGTVTRLSSAISPSCSGAWTSWPRCRARGMATARARRQRSSGRGAGGAARRTPAGHSRRASAAQAEPDPPAARRRRGIAARRPSRAAAQNPRQNENAAAASCAARPRRDRRVQPSVPGLAATQNDGHSVADGPDRLGPSRPIGDAAAVCGAHPPPHAPDALTVRLPALRGQPSRRVARREQGCSGPPALLSAWRRARR